MKVVVIISDLIIGEHIRCLLIQNGYETTEKAYTIKDTNQILNHRDSDFFIVNNDNVNKICKLIENGSKRNNTGKIINFKNGETFGKINENPTSNENAITIIKIPFLNYEVILALVKIVK
jgi:hypothetical protein